MKSATSLFDFGVFHKTVLRFWPIWAGYTFVWLLLLPVSMLGYADSPSRINVMSEILGAVDSVSAWLCMIGACGAAMAAFSHLYSDRAANFFASLPVRREGMFISCAAAALLPLIAGNVLTYFVSLGVTVAIGVNCGQLLAAWLAVVTLETIAFFGLAVLCAQLTGHIVIMPLLFIAANVIGSALGNMAHTVPDKFCYGYVMSSSVWADALSPLISMVNHVNGRFDSVRETGEISGWSWIIAYGVLGVALLPVSLACYKRRAMESAGDVVAIAPLRPVFKYVCAIAAALLLGDLFFDLLGGYRSPDGMATALMYVMCMAAGAFIGYFGAEMLLHKSFGVFSVRKLIGWGVVCVLGAAFVFGCELDATGYETRVPDPAEVTSVRVQTYGANVVFDDPADIETMVALHEYAVENRSSGGIYIQLDYELDGGGELKREYALNEGDSFVTAALNEIMNRPDVILERKYAPRSITPGQIREAQIYYREMSDGDTSMVRTIELTSEEAAELYNECILPDMRDGSIGIIHYGTDEAYYEQFYDCTIYISYTGSGGAPMTISTSPTVLSSRTNDWLRAHDVPLHTLAETGAEAPAS